MDLITVEHKVTPMKLEVLGVEAWPVWKKEVSEFAWSYDAKEVCYILEGEVVVTPDGGEPVTLRPGDLVNFPQGLSCTWQVLSPVKKHYRIES